MKKYKVINLTMVIAMALFLVIPGCIWILAVVQPPTATVGETITVTMDVQMDETGGIGFGISSYGLAATMIPTNWVVDTVKFEGDYGPETMEFLHPDSVDRQPAAGVDAWYDTLNVRYPPPLGMRWVVYQGVNIHNWTEDTTNVTVTFKIVVGSPGTFDIAYFASTTDLGVDPGHYDYNGGNTITVEPAKKLLLSEIVVTPTAGEYVEIYNPSTTDAVDLSNYYLTDATFAGGGTYYYQVVEGGGGGGGFGDWNAHFPDGAMIMPGEYQTIAMNGTGFVATYSIQPTYELFETDPAIPDMREATPGSINMQGGLTNGDEVVILYYWNGLSDLVGDVDYLLYNSNSPTPNDEAVDKTGVNIDGPDADTDSSAYLADTPIANQVSALSHSGGFSTHRIDMSEGTQTSSGGNGVLGADETSENLNVTWTANSIPSPNAAYVPLTARLQVIHNAADPAADTVDVYLNGVLLLDDFVFRTATPFITAPAGVLLNVGVAPGNSTSVSDTLKNFPFLLDAGKTYIGFANGVLDPAGFAVNPDGRDIGFTVYVTEDGREISATSGSVEFLVMHGATDAPFVDVRVQGGSTLVNNAGYGDITGYIPVPPASYILEVTDSTGTTVVGTFLADLSLLADSALAVFASGFLDPSSNQNGEGFGLFAALANGAVVELPVPPDTTVSKRFVAYLDGGQAVPPVTTVGSGSGTFTLNGDSTVLSYEVTVSNLEGDITAAHFHNRAQGLSGGVVKTIHSGATGTGDTTFVGVWTSTDSEPLTAAMVVELCSGNLYVNVHTTLHGSGEVRGQVLPQVSKLLLSEIVARPTGAEYIEIYNPGSESVDLSNYYLGNCTFQGGDTYYYQLVEGGGGGGDFDDFNARFPDGAEIGGGEYQTVAIQGDSSFFAAYGVLPTYELYEDSTNFANDVPDMREAVVGSINGQGGLTNGDEDVELYYWNGMTDMVQDVDYLIYDEGDGGINEQVDKSGRKLDGPDADSDSSLYRDDTAIGSQVPAPINNTADGFSSHRVDYAEGTQTASGGNGVSGADETSENLDVTWTDNSIPTPNGPHQPVGIEDISAIPRSYDIFQNYPNPFNPTTTIKYQLPQASDVQLIIYNSLGQKVRTLVVESKEPGYYEVIWDGRNDFGVQVASGIYLYRIKAGDFFRSKKMLLLK